MPISLKDKVVLITGASSGFGEDAARLFAGEGSMVILAARRIDRLQRLVEEIQASGGAAMAVPVDVSNYHEIDNMATTVLEVYDRVDILFNNAGFGRLDMLAELNPFRDIQTQVAVNLLGLIEVTRCILPHMISRKSGHIINMSSVAGWVSPPRYSVYSATKFGIRGFTNALRREVAQYGIQVSGIYPSSARTEFSLHTGQDHQSKSVRLPSWLVMDSEYVARQVVKTAKQPRRTVILPRIMVPLIWLEAHFPSLVDLIFAIFIKRDKLKKKRPE